MFNFFKRRIIASYHLPGDSIIEVVAKTEKFNPDIVQIKIGNKYLSPEVAISLGEFLIFAGKITKGIKRIPIKGLD